jgi:hypothetical protein
LFLAEWDHLDLDHFQMFRPFGLQSVHEMLRSLRRLCFLKSSGDISFCEVSQTLDTYQRVESAGSNLRLNYFSINDFWYRPPTTINWGCTVKKTTFQFPLTRALSHRTYLVVQITAVIQMPSTLTTLSHTTVAGLCVGTFRHSLQFLRCALGLKRQSRSPSLCSQPTCPSTRNSKTVRVCTLDGLESRINHCSILRDTSGMSCKQPSLNSSRCLGNFLPM